MDHNTDCQQCHACCEFAGYPPFSRMEDWEKNLPTVLRDEILLSMQVGEARSRCLWLTDDGLCAHYELRPQECRDFPVAPKVPGSLCDLMRKRYYGPDSPN